MKRAKLIVDANPGRFQAELDAFLATIQPACAVVDVQFSAGIGSAEGAVDWVFSALVVFEEAQR